MAALWGGVSSHFRDPRGQLQWWIYPLQSEPPLQRFLVHFWVTLSFVTSSVFPYVPPKRLHRPHEYKLNQNVYIVSGTFSSFVFITRPKHVFNLSRSMIFHFQVVASRQCQRKYLLVPFTLHLKKMNTHCQMQILFKIIHFGTTHV